ncbi:MAG: exosortase E/protease, VPEID-CTERM system, partial [Pseudomonadota bacterium]
MIAQISQTMNGNSGRRIFAALCLICVVVLPNWWLYALDGQGLLGTVPASFCLTYVGNDASCEVISKVLPIAFLFSAMIAALLAAGKLPLVRGLFRSSSNTPLRPIWAIAVVAGSFLFMIPALTASRMPSSATTMLVLACWVPALVAMTVGFTQTFYRRNQTIGPALELIGLLLISTCVVFFAAKIGNLLWLEENWVKATLIAVNWLATALGEQVSYNVTLSQITIGNFSSEVGGPCAGLYGIVFNVGAAIAFAVLMQPRISIFRVILVLPIIALASWLLNILRITLLFVIGAHYSPDLAVGGFHTNAGWLMFTGLSVVVFLTIDRIEVFHKRAYRTSPSPIAPNRHDDLSAMTLPFLLFLLTSLIVPALTLTPERLYPFRAVILAAALLYFAPALPKLKIGKPIQSAGAGLLIAVLWLAFGEGQQPRPGFENPP